MLLCYVGYLLQGFQRCQNSQNEDFACRRMGPTSEAQVCSSGRDFLPLKDQVATQGALLCVSSAKVVSKLFGGITSSKSML